MLHSRKRLCALLLAGVMLLTQLPITALAEEYQPVDGHIASFEALPAQVAEQTVPLGTGLDALDLPETVTATVYHVREDVVIPVVPDKPEEPPVPSEPTTEGTEQDAPTPKVPVTGAPTPKAAVADSGETVVTVATAAEDIPVAGWDSAPAYDGDTAGRYVFTPRFQGRTPAPGVQPPEITVTVEEPKPSAVTVTNWSFVDDTDLNGGVLSLVNVSEEQQADFDTVISMLPTRISARIEGEAAPVILDLTWSCPDYRQDEQGRWPLSGTYTFTAALPQGYACDPPPTVSVLLPPSGAGAALLAGEVCICTKPCLKGAVNGECPACSISQSVWMRCGGYRNDYDETLLKMLIDNGLQRQYANARFLLYHGVAKYNSYGAYVTRLTELDISKETLAAAIPNQGPLSGKLPFAAHPDSCTKLHRINCNGQGFTEINLAGVEELYDQAFFCVGNPIRRMILPHNGASFTVASHSGGTVTIKENTYRRNDSFTCTFAVAPDAEYEVVRVDGCDTGDNGEKSIRIDLRGFGEETKVTPVFQRTNAPDGYSAADTGVINQILEANHITAYVNNDCGPWETKGLVTWSSETPKRVTGLNVANMNITTLDLSALTELTSLTCGGNPITSLKLPGGGSLTVITPEKTRVTMDNFDWGTKTATLTAKALTWENEFTQWAGASSSYDPTIALTVNGAIQVTARFTSKVDPVYHPGDVEVIRKLIEDLGLGSRYGDDPAGWSFVIWSRDVLNNKRVIELNLPTNLYGNADLRGLSELGVLNCYESALYGLNVTGLSKLYMMDCRGNRLRSLDLTGCTTLEKAILQAGGNTLLTSYTNTWGYTATVTVTNAKGGQAYLEPSNDLNANIVTVRAVPDTGWYVQSISQSTLDITSGSANAAVIFAEIPAPGAPIDVTAVGGEGQATLKWSSPTSAMYTGYEVTKDGWKTTTALNSNTFWHTFTNLREGAYTLAVRAVNSGVAGPEVSVPCTVSAIKAPGMPQNVSAVAKDGGITLTWKAPNTGSAPTGYQVAIEDWKHPVDLGKDVFTYTFTGLENREYMLLVRGVNKAGLGLESRVPCKVEDTKPPVLSGGAAIRINDNDATVTFTSDEPGAYYILVSGTQVQNPQIDLSELGLPFVTGQNTIPVTGLSAGVHYVYIKARDDKGNVTAQALEVTVPASPALELTIEKTGGGAPALGTDYLYGSDVLTILSDTPMTIANSDPQQQTSQRILVSSPKGANLTLNGVNIVIGKKNNTAAFEIGEATGRAAVKVLLAGENFLTSGEDCAGLQTQHGAELTIDSAAGPGRTDGALTARGGEQGAGIGGGSVKNAPAVVTDITIAGGSVTAYGGVSAAGVGGGTIAYTYSADIKVTITGGEVKAWGNSNSACIGGGAVLDSSVDIQVTITGGTVHAENAVPRVRSAGAGIGLGDMSRSRENPNITTANLRITISDGVVTAKGGASGAGIGRGGSPTGSP